MNKLGVPVIQDETKSRTLNPYQTYDFEIRYSEITAGAKLLLYWQGSGAMTVIPSKNYMAQYDIGDSPYQISAE